MDNNLQSINAEDQLADLLPGFNLAFGSSFTFDEANYMLPDPTFFCFQQEQQQTSDPRFAPVDVIACNEYIPTNGAITHPDLSALSDPSSSIPIHEFFQFDDNATDSGLTFGYELDIKPTFEGVICQSGEPHGASTKRQLLDSVAPVIDAENADSLDLLQDFKTSDGSDYSNMSCADDDVQQYGWPPEDNHRLDALVRGELGKVKENKKLLNWAKITRMFNEQYNQKRSKVQIYSHWRNYAEQKKKPSYSPAEDEAIKALIEIPGMKNEHIAQLVNERSLKNIETRITKINSPTPDEAAGPPLEEEELKRRAKFRERVKSVVLDSGWLIEDVKEAPLPQDLIERMKRLLTMDPQLLKNSHPIGVGRPKKPKTFDCTSRNPYRELASLLRPFTYVNNRRKRTTCLPGDGRRYGLNLFAIYRLLGAPFHLETLPKDPDDVIARGVKEVDLQSFIVMRELIAKHGRRAHQDRMDYNRKAGSSPLVSLFPPMLFLVTGIRSLFLYLATLKYSIDGDDDDAEDAPPSPKRLKIEPADDECEKLISEADKGVMQLLESLFFYSRHLGQAKWDETNNSDIDTDSDEDGVWCETDDDTPDEDRWL